MRGKDSNAGVVNCWCRHWYWQVRLLKDLEFVERTQKRERETLTWIACSLCVRGVVCVEKERKERVSQKTDLCMCIPDARAR